MSNVDAVNHMLRGQGPYSTTDKELHHRIMTPPPGYHVGNSNRAKVSYVPMTLNFTALVKKFIF